MRTIKTSRLRVWVTGQIYYPVDDMTEEELINFEVEGIFGNDNDDNQPMFNVPKDHILNIEIPFESPPANYRINNFIKAKEILARVN